METLKTEYGYEVKTTHKMAEQLGDSYQRKAKQNIDIRSQMKHVIENGVTEEKKRLLKNLGAKIFLKDRMVYLEKKLVR